MSFTSFSFGSLCAGSTSHILGLQEILQILQPESVRKGQKLTQ